MYSFSYLEPVCCSMSSSNCCFLTCMQVSQEAGHVVWYSHLFQNFPWFIVIHTVKGFGIVNKAEIDVFLERSCVSHGPAGVDNFCGSTFSSNCCFLTCIQISQEAGQVVWYSHLFQNFPWFIVIHTVKGFSIVNKAEIDVFLELSCFFDSVDVGNLISGSSAFSKTSLNIREFTVHVLLKPGLENFEHYFTSM